MMKGWKWQLAVALVVVFVAGVATGLFAGPGMPTLSSWGDIPRIPGSACAHTLSASCGSRRNSLRRSRRSLTGLRRSSTLFARKRVSGSQRLLARPMTK